MFRSRDLALRRTHFGALAGFGLLGVFGWPGGREVYGASSQELHVLLKAVVRSGRQSGLLRGQSGLVQVRLLLAQKLCAGAAWPIAVSTDCRQTSHWQSFIGVVTYADF